MTRLTFDPKLDGHPVWSPDGSRIAFRSSRKNSRGEGDLYIKPSSGAGNEELLLETPNDKFTQDWSKDGRFLLYYEVDSKTGIDLLALPMSESGGKQGKPIVVANTPFQEYHGSFSPDGRWVAYHTNESGRFEIVVRSFPESGGKWQVSTNGGISPRWRADSKELFFIGADGKLMAVPIRVSGSTLDAGAPVALFQIPGEGNSDPSVKAKPQYAVSADGRFLINISVEESTTTPITLLQNWRPRK